MLVTTTDRTASSTFDINEPQAEAKTHRESRFFELDENTPDSLPESIVANERLPNVSEFSLFKLEALPIKGLKIFFYSALSLLAVLLAFEIAKVFFFTLSVHWILTALFSLLLISVAALGLRLVYRYMKDSENLSKLVDIQEHAERLSEGNDFGQAAVFIAELRSFYKNKPQADYFDRCINEMPDYSNDREAITHINTVFLKPLDDEAIKRVSSYCVQTGVAVAVSPWASLDVSLSLWRSMKMIDDVAQVYGMRPSLANRIRLLKKVVNQLLFVGLTEIAMESALTELGIQGVAGKLSARAGQGIGAGFYSAKIGIAAMKVSRPIAFTEAEKPRVSFVAAEMIARIKNLFSPKKPA